MLDKNFNIIVGARSSGRSSLLFSIADICKSNGVKAIFFGGTDEFVDSRSSLSIFDRSFFYRHRDDRVTKNVKEICERDNISYLIVDDINFFSESDIKIIQSIRCPKICSCDDKIPQSINNYNHFDISTKQDFESSPWGLKNQQIITIDNKSMKIEDFFTILERDIKINSILKYE